MLKHVLGMLQLLPSRNIKFLNSHIHSGASLDIFTVISILKILHFQIVTDTIEFSCLCTIDLIAQTSLDQLLII